MVLEPGRDLTVGIADCAVVGLPDDEWGQTVALVATVVDHDPDTTPGADLAPSALRAWGKARLAPAKVPVRFELVDELPRNAMGKVTKPVVVERLLAEEPMAGTGGSSA